MSNFGQGDDLYLLVVSLILLAGLFTALVLAAL